MYMTVHSNKSADNCFICLNHCTCRENVITSIVLKTVFQSADVCVHQCMTDKCIDLQYYWDIMKNID